LLVRADELERRSEPEDRMLHAWGHVDHVAEDFVQAPERSCDRAPVQVQRDARLLRREEEAAARMNPPAPVPERDQEGEYRSVHPRVSADEARLHRRRPPRVRHAPVIKMRRRAVCPGCRDEFRGAGEHPAFYLYVIDEHEAI
jgi:hypothetical protein